MGKFIHVRVPASTANLGPGFDTLGVALNLYDDIYMELSDNGLMIDVEGEGSFNIKRDKDNLIYKAAKKVFDRQGIKISGLKIKSVNNIPIGSGLGSSAAAIIGGIVAANNICDNQLSHDEILDMASQMEGHADNVAPALNGGFNVVVFDGMKTYCMNSHINDDICFIAFYPIRELKTTESRGILPEKIDYKDAVFDVGRASLLTALFLKGDYELLKIATQDMLHQVYRRSLIPEMYDVIEASLDSGAYGAFLSGAGPTMMSICSFEKSQGIIDSVKEVYSKMNIPVTVYNLKCDNIGAYEEIGDSYTVNSFNNCKTDVYYTKTHEQA